MSEIDNILKNYASDNTAVQNNLRKILNHGALGGTGRMVILPVDQGFEHGPDKSFAPNPLGYNPVYHYEVAVETGLSAFAAPLGMLEVIGNNPQIPTILKMNSAALLTSSNIDPNQAITATVDDAIRMGCSAIGYTIYPGSDYFYDMVNKLAPIATAAKQAGLVVVVWSYPRGNGIIKGFEAALDISNYAAHIAALCGAHIIKVKIPDAKIMQKDLQDNSELTAAIENNDKQHMVRLVVRSCFAGKRLVVFSGGATKQKSNLIEEVKAIKNGGGNGSIIGRNAFQRNKTEAIEILNEIIEIYKH
jgi:class I fructose-bisphosphate aldolase